MLRKSLPIRGLLVLSLWLSLASQLALSMPLPPERPETSVIVAAGPEPTGLNDEFNVIQGHALTDESPPRPVQNALIVAEKVGTKVTTLTDASGAYTLTVPLGRSSWWVRAVMTDTTTPSNVVPPAHGQWVYFKSGGPYTETRDFIFSVPEAQIVGRVLLPALEIAPTFPVTATATGLVQVSERINADGFFTLTVPAGTYWVNFEVDSDDYRAPLPRLGYVDDQGTWDMGVLYLTPVAEFATLSGQVQTADGQAVPNAPVMAVQLEQTWPPVSSASLEEAERTWTDANGVFTLTVRAGMWWVAVDFGQEGHNCMPHLLQWQTIEVVGPAGTVDDILLVVDLADSHILGTLTEGEGGPQATDACGLVATYKVDEPMAMVYDYRHFLDGVFDLPVISGTYDLAVQPHPDLEGLEGLAPPGCEPGKYLARTVRNVEVGEAVSVPITIPLEMADVTIHGQLWDAGNQQVITGYKGLIIGWSQGNWSATQVYTPTGSGDLRASAGTWWLAYSIDPASTYQPQPGIVRVQVPTNTTEVTATLPVVPSAAVISGTVLDPDGNPLPWVAVTAINLGAPTTGGDQAITREDGQFTLSLDYGDYLVTAFELPEWHPDWLPDWWDGESGGENWISPDPQRVTLTPYTPIQEVNLQFREGDAVIRGRLELGGAAAMADGADVQMPAIAWAVTAGGRTRTRVPMPMKAGDEYRLPVLQGRTWTVGAAYLDQDGTTLWITGTVVAVDTVTVTLDLTLTPAYTLATGLAQSVAPDEPFYGELADALSTYIPAGALPTTGSTSTSMAAALAESCPLLVHMRVPLQRLIDLYLFGMAAKVASGTPLPPVPILPVGMARMAAAASSTLPPEGITLLSPAYEVSAEDTQGNPVTSDLNQPAVIRISYDEVELTAQGFTEDDVQPVYYNETYGGWESVENYVVDEDADEVVIFADNLGTYALMATEATHQVFLPLVLRGFSSF